MTRQEQFDYLFKIVMIGDSGVGKSNLLSRFVDNTFNMDSKPTIGVQFATKTSNVQGKSIKNQIWDTAGQQRFRAITNAYYRGAVGAIIAYDLTKSKTFQNVNKWLGQLKDNADPSITIMLVGNKSDLTQLREVIAQTVQDYVNNNRLIYVETSAATGSNVNQAFNMLIKQIYLKQKAINTPQENFNSVSTTQKTQRTTTASTNVPQTKTEPSKSQPNTTNLKLSNQNNEKQKKKGCC